MKAKFSKRLIAYIIDITIVLILTATISMLVPRTSKLERIYKETDKLTEELEQKKITAKEYLDKSIDLNYDLSKETVIISVIDIAIYIVYFVIYQNKKGQTVGKKLMKIKISNTNTNSLIFRMMILYGKGVSIIDLILLLFISKGLYMNISNILYYMQLVVLLIIISMVIVRKDGKGLHDIICKTEVINEN